MIKPIYEIHNVSSKVKPIIGEDFNELWFMANNTIQNGLGVLWLHNGVYPLEVSQSKTRWLRKEPNIDIAKSFVKVRVFNYDQEVHLWNTAKGIQGRIRSDKEGTGQEYIVSQQVLRGDFATIWQKNSKHSEGAIFLITRQYIGLVNGQTALTDFRFIEFKIG